MESWRKYLNEQPDRGIAGRAGDAFDELDRATRKQPSPAEKAPPPPPEQPEEQRPAPKQPPAQQQKPQQPPAQQQKQSAPMTAQEAVKLGADVYASIANASIAQLMLAERSLPINERGFKYFEANKDLDMARKNPKFFPKDPVAIQTLGAMRDLMNSNRAEFDKKVKMGQNTKIS